MLCILNCENFINKTLIKKSMAIFKGRAKTKRSGSGAKYVDYRKKKLRDLGRLPADTGIGAKRLRKISKGNNLKLRLLSVDEANLFNQKTKKFSKAKILTVIDNPANKHYVRRNIITKGAIINTDKGKAKVVSRPGQDGVVTAVLIE